MKTQTITRENLKAIYGQVCNDWQDKIRDLILWQSGNQIEVSGELLKEAWQAADDAKKELISKYFDIEQLESSIKKIKNFNDVLRVAGKTLEEVIPWKNPKNKAQISQNALAKLQLITEVYNEGTKMDWSNSSQQKWYPWFEKKALGWALHDCSYYGSDAGVAFGSHFKDQESAQDAVKKFMDIYLEYLPE